MSSVLALYDLRLDTLMLIAVLFVETALFLKVSELREVVLARVAIVILDAVLLLAVLFGSFSGGDRYQNAGVLLTLLAVASAVHLYQFRAKGEAFDAVFVTRGGPVSTNGLLVGLLAMTPVVQLQGHAGSTVLALAPFGLLIALARTSSLRGLSIGTWLALVPVHILAWHRLLDTSPPLGRHLGHLVPLAALGILATLREPKCSPEPMLKRIAIYLTGVTFGLGAYTLAEPVSPLIPCVLWLSLSLVALELANRLRATSASAMLQLGYLYLLASGVAYWLVVLQAETYVGPVRARLLIELFGLGTLTFWWNCRPSEELARQQKWQVVHPLFLELLLVATAVFLTVETPSFWRPAVWALVAILLLGRVPERWLAPRAFFYSVVFFWSSAADLVAVVSTFHVPGARWFESPHLTGLLAMALQIVYLITARTRLDLENVEFPAGVRILHRWSRSLDAHRAGWLYYPFFACVAIFLYWRFDREVLTLLWSAEAFVVFVLSAVLRESHFRYMALGAMGACLLRLVMLDMARTDLGVRGLVFVGVGLLLLGMNSVYSRFRARFE